MLVKYAFTLMRVWATESLLVQRTVLPLGTEIELGEKLVLKIDTDEP